MYILAVTLTALTLDRVFGEFRRWHPLVGFGVLADRVEALLYGGEAQSPRARRTRGLVATLIAVGLVVTAVAFAANTALKPAVDVLLLYLATGWKSLDQHACRIHHALQNGEPDTARLELGRIVSRDTSGLDEQAISAATTESVLENGNDAIYGAVFWFAIAGAVGVTVYRLVNTLDAMWGYKNRRYKDFGRASAGLDDVLNYFPSRLTALSYALCGQFRIAIECWVNQGREWKSPNAGPVMASGAGSLGIVLGGPARYHGRTQTRPNLGLGQPAAAKDIVRAIQLVRRALVVFLILLFTGTAIAGQYL